MEKYCFDTYKIIVDFEQMEFYCAAPNAFDLAAVLVKACLVRHYGDEAAAAAAYSDHWARLCAGEASAEGNCDSWSQALKAALTQCEHLFADWHKAPDLYAGVSVRRAPSPY